MRKIWQTTKQVMMFALGGLIVLFAVANGEAVSVNLLFTTVQLSLSLLILISALLGTAFGWLAAALRGRRKRKAIEAGYRSELSTGSEEDWMAEERTTEGVPQSRH
jgi:uncharacterized integral membrane protein